MELQHIALKGYQADGQSACLQDTTDFARKAKAAAAEAATAADVAAAEAKASIEESSFAAKSAAQDATQTATNATASTAVPASAAVSPHVHVEITTDSDSLADGEVQVDSAKAAQVPNSNSGSPTDSTKDGVAPSVTVGKAAPHRIQIVDGEIDMQDGEIKVNVASMKPEGKSDKLAAVPVQNVGPEHDSKAETDISKSSSVASANAARLSTCETSGAAAPQDDIREKVSDKQFDDGSVEVAVDRSLLD